MSKVLVVFWFDTEDYITPESDDSALRLANIFTVNGFKATFKVVGEKARVLQRRGRYDVIKALKDNEIGYHSNYHSKHPVVTEYLRGLDLERGAEEFEKMEGDGLKDLMGIFKVQPSCYGQPGAAWAPQCYKTLRKWNVPVYLDEGIHIGLGNQPFWYGGLLHVFNMGENCIRMQLGGKDEYLEKAKEKFMEVYNRLRSRGGGTISIYYHPCEFNTSEFWDGINYARGVNAPDDKLKLPNPRPADVMEKDFYNFSQYVSFIASQCDVVAVTASELTSHYKDRSRDIYFGPEEIMHIAEALEGRIDWVAQDKWALSPAEVFYLLAGYIASDGKARLKAKFIDCPIIDNRESNAGKIVSLESMKKACQWAWNYMEAHNRVPDMIPVGDLNVNSGEFLMTMAYIAQRPLKEISSIGVQRVKEYSIDRCVADDSRCWNWIIFPEKFSAPDLINLGKLQAWTIKPAILTEKD
ncbi:hypothetical protein SAMN02746089_00151 [Caldanaerobius fijiensis DSM 17918]|uniref:Polysaccharide deacetylase n=1 Tax=Caldanaerobius fijiensis DSM 17918 TaxID=1121256 RepID=A0A1M4SXL3_9THEO|nr:hypothetical protein [Caldanaerobius fijiensis]SHE36757.1 hypothetical protein SAMN02746089_00151 [Caldanaerobius fijiensis DSM 17918]